MILQLRSIFINNREDKVLVVGAHWDTTGFTDGYNDNGSGGQNTTIFIKTTQTLLKS